MTDPVLRLVSWNCGLDPEAWALAAAEQADVVLLQRAPGPPPEGLRAVAPLLEGWPPGTEWGTAIAVRGQVDAEPVPLAPLDTAGPGQLAVSRAGSLAVARVTPPGEPPLLVVSVYAAWQTSHDGRWGYPDAAAHRVVSDLAALVGEEGDHRLVVVGDWNVARGHHGDSPYWQARYLTVFDRLQTLGLRLAGPFEDVARPLPTYKEADGSDPRQLDYVFVSPSLEGRVRTSALDGESWQRDHCRVAVDLLP